MASEANSFTLDHLWDFISAFLNLLELTKLQFVAVTFFFLPAMHSKSEQVSLEKEEVDEEDSLLGSLFVK